MSASSLATSLARGALFAILLSACAHQGAQVVQTGPSYLGGRAAQPGGFNATARTPFEQTPEAHGLSYLGGQAGQPHAWLGAETRSVATVEPTCVAAGRAAQPFSGPTLYTLNAPAGGGASCSTRALAPSHF